MSVADGILNGAFFFAKTSRRGGIRPHEMKFWETKYMDMGQNSRNHRF